jgi:hypothetical protein
MKRTNTWLTVVLLATVGCALPAGQNAAAQSTQGGSSELSGLASASGTVTSYAPFKAAKVYFRNVDRRMQYMVYTAGGKYQAMWIAALALQHRLPILSRDEHFDVLPELRRITW